MKMKYKIIHSDVYAGLFHLKNNSVNVAVTSPPYWGQRDYGFTGQIGNEETEREYILKLTKIFSLLREKLTSDGIFFLNIGDKYLSKYGKSPLGMIPYKLAHTMVKYGWFLNDIIIWYKPNHMPSSIKNRFTNSYEPVFVFSQSEKNIYNETKTKNSNYSNVIRINLQPTPYKHVAVYPEKLVRHLLQTVKLSDASTILDPFAGSGTTLKVVKEDYPNSNAVMIENNESYIEIIKQRCGLNGEVKILKYDFTHYNYSEKQENGQLKFFENETLYEKKSHYNKSGFVKIADSQETFYSLLKLFQNSSIKQYLDLNATCFLGCRDFDIDLIYKTSLLNNYGWVIRNVIVVEEKNRWFPLFMIVDDNKKMDYIFNYRRLNLKSKTEYIRNWEKTNFVGYKVMDSVNKVKREGTVVKVVGKLPNGFPKFVIVKWDNNTFTKEFVIYSQDEVNRNLIIIKTNEKITMKEKASLFPLDTSYSSLLKVDSDTIIVTNNKEQYDGKFKEEKRFNWGASPGARSSVEQEYFSLQRLYEIEQDMISDYINLKRLKKGLTKNNLINFFPRNHKHTVGHWLRNDFGGSIPIPEDWKELSQLLEFEKSVTNCVCKTALKLQTVRNGEYKLPDDFVKISSLSLIEKLIEQ